MKKCLASSEAKYKPSAITPTCNPQHLIFFSFLLMFWVVSYLRVTCKCLGTHGWKFLRCKMNKKIICNKQPLILVSSMLVSHFLGRRKGVPWIRLGTLMLFTMVANLKKAEKKYTNYILSCFEKLLFIISKIATITWQNVLNILQFFCVENNSRLTSQNLKKVRFLVFFLFPWVFNKNKNKLLKTCLFLFNNRLSVIICYVFFVFFACFKILIEC